MSNTNPFRPAPENTSVPSEAPPPYTPNPAVFSGESTLEQGPARPFQPAPPPANPQPRPSQSSFFRQLSDSFTSVRANLSTYPGQHQPSPGPPPRHPQSASTNRPLSPSSSTSHPHPSSDFAADFYAAGSGQFAPPPGPPPSSQSRPPPVSNDGRPTTHPVVGHPLLKEGKVLVYPKGYQCDKCHNVGYKDSNPDKPCMKCWNKYAKPFTGPLAYSFSPASTEGNFQRPLSHLPTAAPPPPRPPPPPPPGAYGPPVPPRPAAPYVPPHSFYQPPNVQMSPYGRPPPGSIVYTSGDPRLGGRLCWNCNGKGNVSFFLDRTTCTTCNGLGRIFP